jgi:glycosyltransferase involved in cell wall biosynthesis
MRKVLFVIDNLGSGGAQNQITLIAAALKKEGYEVGIFTYFPEDFFLGRVIENNIKVHSVTKSGKIGINVIINLYQTVINNNYEVIISFLKTPNFYSALIKKYFGKKIKLIISYRSMTEFGDLSFFKKLMLKWSNKTADIIIANSHHERKRWELFCPDQAHKWQTIYNMVENRFSQSQGIKRANNYIVVGSISADKNGLTIIEAMNILKQKGKNIKLTWIGQKVYAIRARKNYLSAMIQKIEDYNLRDNFAWMEASLNIEKNYMESKALILASTVEGLPNVLCEAMSTGTPCLASNVLDHPLIVCDSNNGFLFDPLSPSDLAEAIERMETLSPQNYDKMCNAAVSRARKVFNNSIFLEQYQNLIK